MKIKVDFYPVKKTDWSFCPIPLFGLARKDNVYSLVIGIFFWGFTIDFIL